MGYETGLNEDALLKMADFFKPVRADFLADGTGGAEIPAVDDGVDAQGDAAGAGGAVFRAFYGGKAERLADSRRAGGFCGVFPALGGIFAGGHPLYA